MGDQGGWEVEWEGRSMASHQGGETAGREGGAGTDLDLGCSRSGQLLSVLRAVARKSRWVLEE